MAAFLDTRVRCEVCDSPATRLVECMAPIYGIDVDRLYMLVCDSMVCLGLGALWAEGRGVHADTRPLDRGEAEAVTGLDLGEAA